jgi:hypothetical protein
LGKKKSTDDRNVFYAPPRPTIIHSPATQDLRPQSALLLRQRSTVLAGMKENGAPPL